MDDDLEIAEDLSEHSIDFFLEMICREHHIPFCQAGTINLKKLKAYKKYLQSPEARLEQWLDDQEIRRKWIFGLQKQWEKGHVHE